jgi:hypothetical protein
MRGLVTRIDVKVGEVVGADLVRLFGGWQDSAGCERAGSDSVKEISSVHLLILFDPRILDNVPLIVDHVSMEERGREALTPFAFGRAKWRRCESPRKRRSNKTKRHARQKSDIRA